MSGTTLSATIAATATIGVTAEINASGYVLVGSATPLGEPTPIYNLGTVSLPDGCPAELPGIGVPAGTQYSVVLVATAPVIEQTFTVSA